MGPIRRWSITIEMKTPYNPNKWDWDELLAGEPGEEILSVDVKSLGRYTVFDEVHDGRRMWGIYDEETGDVLEWFATKRDALSGLPDEA